MKKHKREKLKTQLLLCLIVLSLVQLGIHWNQQAQGFPFRFISEIFNYNMGEFPTTNVEDLKYLYFMPESVTVSVDPTAARWKFGQNDPYYSKIWNDVKNNYFHSMINQKPEKTMSKDQWSRITGQRCIIIDFSVNWPNDIIFWLENSSVKDNKSFESLKSIAIVPDDDVNETVNTLYAYDGKQVYQYQINIRDNFLPKKFYLQLKDELDSRNVPTKSLLTTVFNFTSKEDILISLSREMSTFSTLRIEIPPNIQLNRQNIENETIQDSILLSQKVSLMAKYYEDLGEAQFTDTENLYKLHINGLLEYFYLPGGSKDAGAASAAFSQALSFIELRRSLLGEVDLVLSSIEKTKNGQSYEMHFDYQMNGVPVFYGGAKDEDRITSPLIIKANAERVLECHWILRSITDTGSSQKYSLNFTTLANQLIPQELIDEIFYKKKNVLERIEAGYIFRLDQLESKTIIPKWVITITDKDFVFPLLSEED